MYPETAKIYSKNESFIHETVKKKKEICASFAFAPQTTKVMTTVSVKCLLWDGKGIKFVHEDIWGEKETIFT